MTALPPACPLCDADAPGSVGHVHGRDYFDCQRCGLIYVHPSQLPDADVERARYETHRNDPEDAGYRAFLARLMEPLLERVPPGARGLDYGSGPGPALSAMLTEHGRITLDYDPIFAPDDALLDGTYDFIACSETVEHFHRPASEFERLDRMLKPGGWLGVMTTMRDDARPFAEWWYVRDATHVCFYRPRTMSWIADAHGWSLDMPRVNVALFLKGSA